MSRSFSFAVASGALAVLLVGCADATPPEPTARPSHTPPPSASPAPDPDPLERSELPVDCLAVLAPEILDGIAGFAPFEASGYDARIGTGPYAPLESDDALVSIRSASCFLESADGTRVEIGYSEFDPAQTDARLADLAAFGDDGEVYQPPGTDLALGPVPGIAEAQQLQIPFDGHAKTWVLGPGWEVYVDVPWIPADVAAPLPDLVVGALASLVPVNQRCESMLPIPTDALDLAVAHDLSSSETVASPEAIVCHAGEASGFERALWWEEVASDVRDGLLADAAAGVDGARLQGSTTDGSGVIVALADDTRIVVFDDHLVHVDIPIDGELALQLAREVHAPAWLPVPPVA